MKTYTVTNNVIIELNGDQYELEAGDRVQVEDAVSTGAIAIVPGMVLSRDDDDGDEPEEEDEIDELRGGGRNSD